MPESEIVPSAEPKGSGAVGQGDYIVKRGDTIESIAFEHGFFHETLWNHPANAELKQKRGNRNLLLPGDRVTIPEKTPKQVTCKTGRVHRFRRRGVPAVFRLQLLQRGAPLAGADYTLDVDGVLHSGTTSEQGMLEERVPPNARRARLQLQGSSRSWNVLLGDLDPIKETTGLQQRLRNLGYRCEPTGVMDERTRSALRAFQGKADLTETGEPDDPTLKRLRELHDLHGV
jgi:Putative peptidoglycan binding domain